VSKAKNTLTRKLGPLPVWAWALIGGVALYWYRNRGGGSATVATANVPAAPPTGTFPPGKIPKIPKPPKHHKRHRKPKPKPKPHHAQGPHHPHPKPKRRQLIPGRKPHPHPRTKAHPPPRRTRSRSHGAKLALTRAASPADSPLVQTTAYGSRHHAAAMRLRFHAPYKHNTAAGPEHYAADLARPGNPSPPHPSRPARLKLPAPQPAARRSHADAAAHARPGVTIRASNPQPAPQAAPPPARAKVRRRK
jgi:hypothetical protein